MEYYQILRNLREDNDLTQNEIREYLHLGKNTYSNYENGLREIPFSLVIELSKKYRVSLDYIAGLTADKGGLHKNSKEEQEVLKLYNQLTEKNKGKAEILLSQLLKKQDSKETESGQEQKVKKYENNISISQRDNGKVNIKNK